MTPFRLALWDSLPVYWLRTRHRDATSGKEGARAYARGFALAAWALAVTAVLMVAPTPIFNLDDTAGSVAAAVVLGALAVAALGFAGALRVWAHGYESGYESGHHNGWLTGTRSRTATTDAGTSAD